MKLVRRGPTLQTFSYSDTQMEKFYKPMKHLSKDVGCNYLAYFIEDENAKRRVGFTSNPEWQNEYLGGLIDDCHLWRIGNKLLAENKSELLAFPWECVAPGSAKEKDVHLYRAEKGIGANGISFCLQRGGIKEYFAIAPDPKNPLFLEHVSKNIPLIKSQMWLFRQVSWSCLKTSTIEKAVNVDS